MHNPETHPYLDELTDYLREHGPIPTVRVSSARARGAARQYCYWGAVRYEIRLSDTRDRPCHYALECGGSDRRSIAGAERDAAALALREGRLLHQAVAGHLSEDDAASILARVCPAWTQRYQSRLAASVRQMPHWLDRMAAGVLAIPAGLPDDLQREITVRRDEIVRLRTTRQRRRVVAMPRPVAAAVMVHGVLVRATYDRSGPYARQISWEGQVTRRLGAIAVLRRRVRRYGRYGLVHSTMDAGWTLHPTIAGSCDYGMILASWPRRPTRHQLAVVIRELRATEPSATLPASLGWRAWTWSSNEGVLISPHQRTPWPTAALQSITWSEEAALRGQAGIHARLPRRDWRRAIWREHGVQEGPQPADTLVTGLVERYGRAIVGPQGWRAEHVVIRGLVAPTPEIELRLRERYPDAEIVLAQQEVHHAHR